MWVVTGPYVTVASFEVLFLIYKSCRLALTTIEIESSSMVNFERQQACQEQRRDGPTARKPRCGSSAPRRHFVLCDGVVVEFGIEFTMLDRCTRLGNMIQHSKKKAQHSKKKLVKKNLCKIEPGLNPLAGLNPGRRIAGSSLL